MKKFHWILAVVILSISILSCLNNDQLKTKPSNDLYFDYRISGAENEEKVVVYLQIKRGKNGPAERLNAPSKILFDNEEITADSAGLTGVYYELQKPLQSFAGKHEIVVVSKNKQYKEEFLFKPFSLKSKLPTSINRDDLRFDFDGLEKTDLLRIVATDTSFSSNDINEFDTTRNGRLVISANQLNNLEGGPINLIFSKELERPVKNGTPAGGRIAISYEIRRQFLLKPGRTIEQMNN